MLAHEFGRDVVGYLWLDLEGAPWEDGLDRFGFVL